MSSSHGRHLVPISVICAILSLSANAQVVTNLVAGVPPPTIEIVSIAVQDSNMYVATGSRKVIHSSDFGASWNVVLDSIYELASVVAVDSYLVIGIRDSPSGGGIILRTRHDGQWNTVPTDMPKNGIYKILVSGTLMYAATSLGVFVSRDGGLHWNCISYGFVGLGVNALFVSDSVIVAGQPKHLYRSTDAGSTWSEMVSMKEDYRSFSFATTGGAIFAGHPAGGIFRSIDAGLSWNIVVDAMSIPTVNFILASGDTLIVGSESNGLYRSTDIGRTWTTFNAGLPPFPNVRALLQTPRGLLLGLEQEGLYTSTDRRTWKATDSSLADIQVLTYCLIDSIVHAGLSNGALLTSTDRGNNWLRTPTPWSGRITSLAAQGPNLFASVWDEGIYLSTDGGRSWPVQNPALSSSRIHSLVAVDSDVAGGRVFAGTEEASYMSSDGGTTWYESSLPVHRITGTARSQLGLFAGAHEGKIFRSVDRGSTWSQICTTEHKIRAITATRNTIASCGDGGFYALNQFTLRGQRWEGGAEVPWSAGRAVGFSSIGLYFGGVAGFWYSSFHDTSAASWLKWSIVLPFARTTVSAFISLDSVLLIGTNGGILRCNLDRLIVGVEEPHPVSDTPTILELYPHPVHERASVAFQLEHDTPVELFLLDQAGRHISLLSSSMYPRGRHVVPLDAEFLARGLYICILSTPTHQFTRLFVLR